MNTKAKREEYRRKNLIYGAVLITLMVGLYLYRNHFAGTATASTENSPVKQNTVALYGQTMGTVPYTVKYIDSDERNFKAELDSLLIKFNESLSTYIPDSEISRFNKQSDTLTFELPYFYPVLKASKEIYETTNGAFDPTVLPLVNAWGFGPNKKQDLEAVKVDSLRALVNFPAISFDETQVQKTDSRLQLDFSAIAKGYAVDVLGDFLESQDISDYMVEIGGEVRCRGENGAGETWRIGIEDPIKAGQGEIVPLAVVNLKDRSMATSGNYRNYYVKDGKRYVHTISPQTGYPVEHSLLSVSVIAPNCMEADAYATAFMVLGLEESQRIAREQPEVEAFFIYDDEGQLKSAQTTGLEKIVETVP